MTPGGSALGVVVRLDTVDSTQSAPSRRSAAPPIARSWSPTSAAGRGRRGRTWAPTDEPAGLDHRAAARTAGAPVHLVAHDRGRRRQRPRAWLTWTRGQSGRTTSSCRAGRSPESCRTQGRTRRQPAHAGPAIVTTMASASISASATPGGSGGQRRRSRSRQDRRPAASRAHGPPRGFDAWRARLEAKASARSAKDGGASATHARASGHGRWRHRDRDRPRRRWRAALDGRSVGGSAGAVARARPLERLSRAQRTGSQGGAACCSSPTSATPTPRSAC